MTGSSVFTDAAEFHAIGLRPMEFRPGVIRRAMNRSAAPLANLHLTEPSVDLEAKLARVVMTGYRLLDPRRREDSIQRMMLGRIHPQLADEAARMAQSQVNQAMFGQGSDGDSEPMVGRGLIGSQNGKQSNRYFLHDPVSESLRSHDLLIERASKRFVRLPKQWDAKKATVVMGASISSLLFGFFVWDWLSPDKPSSATDRTQQASVLPQDEVVPAVENIVKNVAKVLPSPEVMPIQSTPQEAAVLPSEATIAPVLAVPIERAPSTTIAESAADPSAPSTVASAEPPSDDLLPATDAAVANANGSMQDVDSTAEEQIQPNTPTQLQTTAPEPVIAVSPTTLPSSDADASDMSPAVEPIDPSEAQQAALEASIPIIPSVETPAIDQAIAIEEVQASPQRRAVPQPSELAGPLAQWEASQQGLLANDWSVRMQRSLEFARDMAPLEDEQSIGLRRWIGLHAATRFAVLQGRFTEADQSMASLTNSFETDDFAVAAAVCEQLRAMELEPATTAYFGEWLEIWTGRALLAAQMEQAGTFADLLRVMAEKNADKLGSARASDWEKSIATSNRLMTTVTQLDESVLTGADVHDLSPSDHYAVGRYWALVRRDWKRAVPHLIRGSDARLSSIATLESTLSDLPTAEQVTNVASGYVSLAEKTNGWLRDSYLIHADEILGRKVSDTDQSATLELSRYRKQLQEEHADAFAMAQRISRPTQALPNESILRPVGDESSLASSPKPAKGLSGRILAEGIDVGVELSVEPGARVTRKAFDQIASRLDVNLTTAKMILGGVITVDQPTAVVIHLTNLGESSLQSLSVDNKEILPVVENVSHFDHELVYRVDLQQGSWTLQWIAPVIAGRDLTFRVSDGLSGMPLSLETPVAAGLKPANEPTTKLRVTVITGQ